jgi:ADP-ribose pyrophosphatase
MKGWKTLSRRVVLKRGKWLTVEDHTVRLPDGTVIERWPWISTPEFVNVVALTGEGKFLCFRQGKYALERETLAPVGGYLEQGEAPLDGAKRELREETGYEASEWIELGRFVMDANRGVSTGHLYLARGARKVGEPGRGDELEEQELVLLDRAEVESALTAGRFAVMPWAANVALALRRLDQK